MKTITKLLLELWNETRTRFSNQVENLSRDELIKRFSNPATLAKSQPQLNTEQFKISIQCNQKSSFYR
jgi:hypothetical protein